MSEFNAADARDKVREWKLEGISRVLACIEIAAESGSNSTVFCVENNFNDTDAVRQDLCSRGFTVKVKDHNVHGPELHISW